MQNYPIFARKGMQKILYTQHFFTKIERLFEKNALFLYF